ncbi:hypothetical protein A2U01_0075940, partial [Trifolium medium]|nr:hypothetical protein [Trifolium medium]
MRVHEELLNLAVAEEEAVIHRIKVLEDELKILHKKREDFCLSNKDEISLLLAKRRSLARLEAKTRNMGDDLKKIMEDLGASKKCK